MISEGDIVVAELPQADGNSKARPVLILRELPGFGDFLVCGISTQIRQAEEDFDVVLGEDDADFSSTGLKATSVVRLSFVSSIQLTRMRRHLGNVSSTTLETLQSNLAAHLMARH
ncbi:MAG: type II toxin-antitoxin system PemK/MazF family toxin [Verrucomicrobiota bacterium]